MHQTQGCGLGPSISKRDSIQFSEETSCLETTGPRRPLDTTKRLHPQHVRVLREPLLRIPNVLGNGTLLGPVITWCWERRKQIDFPSICYSQLKSQWLTDSALPPRIGVLHPTPQSRKINPGPFSLPFTRHRGSPSAIPPNVSHHPLNVTAVQPLEP